MDNEFWVKNGNGHLSREVGKKILSIARKRQGIRIS